MTFKSRFLILYILQIKYWVFCTYWASKFSAEILKVMNSDFDLQMTFKSRFLILCILQIKYFEFFVPIGLINFGLKFKKSWTLTLTFIWPSNHDLLYYVCYKWNIIFFGTYWVCNFCVQILRVMDYEFDLQMTFNSWFLIVCVFLDYVKTKKYIFAI